MIKLCIFDLDGTVLNTLETIAYYGNRSLALHGIKPIETREYRYLVGTGIKNLIKNMLNFRNCYSEELFKSVYHDYDTAYNADVAYKTVIYDGLKETLDTLKSQGIRLAIVSNKPDFAANTVIRTLFGEGYFDYVTGQKPDGVLKPDPSVVREVIKIMNVCTKDCLYIGDTSTDMKTGKNAGIFTMGVSWGFRDEPELVESGADLILHHPIDLLNYIQTVQA